MAWLVQRGGCCLQFAVEKGAAMVKWFGVSVTALLGAACLGFAGLWAYAIVTGDKKVGLPT